MNRARTSAPPTDVDLQVTRRTFLFAREQVAANTYPDRSLAAREMRRWQQHRARVARGTVEAQDSPAR
jgi:hypothetical protein